MNETKDHCIHVRGVSKSAKNSLKKLAKEKRLSVNSFILTIIDEKTSVQKEVNGETK